MNDSPFNLTPIHVVGAISIEAKQLAEFIDTAASKGGTIDIEAITAAIQRMYSLASAVRPADQRQPHERGNGNVALEASAEPTVN